MLWKSIIAGIVLSLMAGGIVYFGTDLDTAAMKDKVAAKTAELKADVSDKVMASGEKTNDAKIKENSQESSIETPSVKTASGKVIEAKNPTISHASKTDTSKPVEKQSKAPKTDPSNKKWLDQYLKKDKAEKEATTKEVASDAIDKNNDEKPEVAKDIMKRMGLAKKGSSDSDTGTLIVEKKAAELTEDDVATAEAEGFEKRALETENIWGEDKAGQTGKLKRREMRRKRRKMLRDIRKKKDGTIPADKHAEGKTKIGVKVMANENGVTTIETETIDIGDGEIMKIVKKTVKTEDGQDQKIYDKDISETVEMVMTEIQKINKIELRDRAYFSLICFGLDHKNYNVADQALEKIMHPEIRDQARTHIAVAHAKAGQPDEAWGMLDDLEIEASRDVMRLEIIEAIIAPQQAQH